MRRKNAPRIAVVGATGMVGRELIALLEKRRFPAQQLLAFSSGEKKKTVRFRGRALKAPAVDEQALASCQLVFMVSSEETSSRFAPRLAKKGIWVIDDSAEFRLDKNVPLVIPEVNASALRRDRKIIASPNCTMTGLAVAAIALHRAVGVEAARISSYQAISGAGKAALEEFFSQHRRLAPKLRWQERAPVLSQGTSQALPRPGAFNVFPQVGRFDGHGRSSEENKVAAELRKIWQAPKLAVSVTAVRVPVVRGHCLSVWLSLKSPLSPQRARALLKKTPGLKLYPDGDYPTALSAGGRWPVYVGRLRRGINDKEICLWVACDNLLKGAALNSVQIAETLLKRRWLA